MSAGPLVLGLGKRLAASATADAGAAAMSAGPLVLGLGERLAVTATAGVGPLQ
jgi:hypothetical protein